MCKNKPIVYMQVNERMFRTIRQAVLEKNGEEFETELYARIGERPILYIEHLLHGNNLFEKDLKTREYLWMEFLNNDRKEEMVEKKTVIIEDEIINDSVVFIPCPRCGGKTTFETVQTRSGDEAMTEFYKCQNKNCCFEFKK